MNPEDLDPEEFKKYTQQELANLEARKAHAEAAREYIEQQYPKLVAAVKSGNLIAELHKLHDEEMSQIIPEDGAISDRADAFDIRRLSAIGEIEEAILRLKEG
jgi:hypothetical protein